MSHHYVTYQVKKKIRVQSGKKHQTPFMPMVLKCILNS